MSRTRREEERLLATEERELVAQAHLPALKSLGHGAVSDLLHRLRDRRDRARDIARQQRREIRGKVRPSGSTPASDNTGSRAKAQVLAAAVKRVNKEVERRRASTARQDLVANARKALELTRSADEPDRPVSRTADNGMHPIANRDIAPSGALNAEGHRPVLERSRKVR